MNITIFSGGSGSSQLVKGLYSIVGGFNKITHILNLYDDGKSTGVCRKVADVLGPSDMRKVHYLHYSETFKNNINSKIKSLYESRYDFGNSKENNIKDIENNIINIILSYKDSYYNKAFIPLIKEFFNLAEFKGIYDFDDFSIINIIYSMLFRINGIRNTHLFMMNFLGLDLNKVDILINSDKLYTLGATTKDNSLILNDECSIVSLDNKDVVIDKILFQVADRSYAEYSDLNSDVLKELNNTDLIILSSGTQMSSLIPSYLNEEIQRSLHKNAHKIIMIMNNIDDKDMIGVDAKGILKKIPYFINNSKILFNKDSNSLMRLTDDIREIYNNCYEYSMDCDKKGKHNSIKLVKGIFSIYYNIDLFKKYDHVFIDFDDTVWPRKEDFDMLGPSNMNLLNTIAEDITSVSILSGNSITSILEKIKNENLWVSSKLNVWADSCCIKYYIKYYNENYIGNLNYICDGSILDFDEIETILDFINKINEDNHFICDIRGDIENNRVTCINIKPKFKNQTVDNRHVIIQKFESMVNLSNVEIRSVGTTSIEFVRKGITKSNAFTYVIDNEHIKNENVIFIGDELEGNDNILFNICKNKIEVKNCNDTNIILMCLIK